MRLRNEGPIQPAPRLKGHAGMLAAAIESWSGVEAFTHWRLGSPGTADGAEYHVGEGELGHIHLDATAHVLLNKEITALLEQKQLGKTPGWSKDWISFSVKGPADVQHAAWLFRLAYARLSGGSDQEMLNSIASRPAHMAPQQSA